LLAACFTLKPLHRRLQQWHTTFDPERHDGSRAARTENASRPRPHIAHGRTLTNAETNQVKKEYIDKLMAQRDAEAKKARKLKKAGL
jgi:hypothetical protein